MGGFFVIKQTRTFMDYSIYQEIRQEQLEWISDKYAEWQLDSNENPALLTTLQREEAQKFKETHSFCNNMSLEEIFLMYLGEF